MQAVSSDFIAEQCGDAELKVFIDYVRDGKLPEDEKAARKVVLHGKYFDIVDGILHHENPLYPGRRCVVVPGKRREGLIEEAHDGHFAGHFAEKRIYELLRWRYWWPQMRADVKKYCRSCLVCGVMVVRSGQLCSLSL